VLVWRGIELRANVQVLEVATRELGVGNNLDLAIADLGDLDDVTEVTDAALNLDAVLEELLEGGDVEDLVGGWLRSIDDELVKSATCCHAFGDGNKLTFLVTLACLPFGPVFYIANLSLLSQAIAYRGEANSKAISCTYSCWCHCEGLLSQRSVYPAHELRVERWFCF
jgi:hypothetical protein